jgi:hypothetical protein
MLTVAQITARNFLARVAKTIRRYVTDNAVDSGIEEKSFAGAIN